MKFRQLISLFLTAGLLFTGTPAFAAVSTDGITIDARIQQNGEVLSLVNEPERVKTQEDTSVQSRNGNLPESYHTYDLRNVNGQNYVSPVRNQGALGTCWAFGAVDSLESNRLMQGLDANAYSQKALAWYAYQYQQAEGADSSLLEGASLGNIPEGETGRYYQAGAHTFMAANQLATGIGASTAAAVPYTNSEGETTTSGDWSLDQTHMYDGAYRLENAAYQFMAPDMTDDERNAVNDWVKEQIMENGAVIMMYGSYGEYNTFPAADDPDGPVNLVYTAKDAPWGTSANHFVTLVGWNDDYPKENFPKEATLPDGTVVSLRPEHDGVWIMKNSWGEDAGDGGYYLVSYDDASINNFVSYTEDTSNDYDNRLQYDYAGYKDAAAFDVETEISQRAYGAGQVLKTANIFTVDTPQTLTAVSASTYNWESATIQVDVYKITDSTNPESGEKVASQTYSGIECGYQMLDLATPVQLNAGESFSVVETIQITLEDGSTQYGLPIEMATTDPSYSVDFSGTGQILSHLYKATCQPGESFVYGIGPDGSTDTWRDLADQEFVKTYLTFDTTITDEEGKIAVSSAYPGNACIKAFTVDAVAAPTLTSAEIKAFDDTGRILETL